MGSLAQTRRDWLPRSRSAGRLGRQNGTCRSLSRSECSKNWALFTIGGPCFVADHSKTRPQGTVYGCLADDLFRARLHDDNPALDSKLDEIGARPKAEILHDSVFMKRHRTRRDLQHPRSLFHRFPFCQKLDDFSLTPS